MLNDFLQMLVNVWDIYSETCLYQTSLRPTVVFEIDRCSYIQVKLTKISLLGLYLKVQFIEGLS